MLRCRHSCPTGGREAAMRRADRRVSTGVEVRGMPQPAPASLALAIRLRSLRTDRWPEIRLTQGMLASALGGAEPLAAYAQFFATRRPAADAPRLISVEDFTPGERAAYEELSEQLLSLHTAA